MSHLELQDNISVSVATQAEGWSLSRMVARMQHLRRHSKGLVGGLVVMVACLIALAAPLLQTHDPIAQDLSARLLPPAWAEGGNPSHLLGTDGLGRDLFSRILHGARISLAVSVSASLLAVLAGVLLGLMAGYFRGRVDTIIMALVDVQLAFPFMLLALTFMTVFEPSLGSLIVVLSLSGWAGFGRMVRGQVLSLRERDYVLAARALGASDLWIIARHIFPNTISVVIVLMTINVARFVLAEASLSFIGLGVSPQTPSWGAMINEGRQYVWNAWWITAFPGIALVITVLGVGLLGDWLRDRSDPRSRLL